MRFVRHVVVLAFAGALGACGLSMNGTLPEGSLGDGGDGVDGAAVDAPTPDAAVALEAAADGGGGGGPDAADAADSGTCQACGLTPPAGWSLVMLTTSATACPPGSTSKDLLENPSAPPDACTCSCSVTASPACTSAMVLGTSYDSGGGACDLVANAQTAVADGTCRACNMNPGAHERFPSPPPIGPATCSATVTPDKSKVQSTAMRACTPSSCNEACAGGAFKTCLVTPGDQACPAATPEKHLLGTDTTLSCPSCGCSAAPTPTCAGNWSLYKKAGCAAVDLAETIPADTCASVDPATVHSYKWLPPTASATCTPAPAAGSVSLTGTTTICCM
jgi:hypothetical protein